MKMRSLALSLLTAFVLVSSCKKDAKKEEPVITDPELLGAQTSKVLHYSFNGSLTDGSGNHLNASTDDGLTYTADRFGRPAQAAVFGGNSQATWVSTPSLSTKVTTFPFAISLWFKTAQTELSQTLIRSDGGESGAYCGYWLQLGVPDPGTMSLSFGDNTDHSSTARNTITTPAVFSPNTWYHIVINVRGENNMDFYINGVKNDNCTYSGSATTMVYHPNNSGGVIGLFPGTSSIFDGLMDDYRIYTKVLSQTEVTALYNFHP